ncbi:MAG: hypothetical protein QOG62_845 [Thermoleophilaceae bacterium]|nr:hypothetical protein [Thermoleophilaceae bacterium]
MNSARETTLVGRADELVALERALDGAGGGQAGLLQVIGEPGIGKSQVLAELAERADGRGFLVLAGRAAEFERDVPFAVFVNAMDDYLGSLNQRAFNALGRERTAEVARVFPGLGELAGELAPSLQSERYRLHDAVRALLDVLASGKPLLLVLDDVHWADEASLELLAHLVRRPPTAGVLTAVAARPRQSADLLVQALGLAVRDGLGERLELGPLSQSEAGQLLGDSVPADSRESLYRESGGNPFYLEQLARHGGAVVSQGADPFSVEGVPAAVTAALAEELDALPGPVRTLAQAAAVVGEPFETDLAAGVADLSPDVSIEALDALLDGDLVRPTDVPRRFRFRHPIVRRAVYEWSKPGWRLTAHERAARLLAAQGATPGVRARHVEQSARPGDTDAISVLGQAGQEATGRAPAAAAHWFGAALRLVPADDAGKRLEMLIPQAKALAAAGRLAEARQALHDTVELLPPELAAIRGQIVAAIAMVENLMGRHGEATALLEQALDELTDAGSPEAAALMIELANDGLYAPDYQAMIEWSRRAYEIAGELEGHQALMASAAGSLALAEYNVGDIASSRVHLEEAAAIVERLTEAEQAEKVSSLLYVGWTRMSLEDFDEGIRILDRGLEVCAQTGQDHLIVPMLIGKAICLTWQGRLREAGELAERIVQVARLSGNDQSRAWALTLRSWVATFAGDLSTATAYGEEAIHVVEHGVLSNYFSALTHSYYAETRLENGDPERCISETLSALGGEDLPVIEISYRSHCYEILTRAALAADRLEDADRYASLAEAAVEGIPLGGRVGEARRARAAVYMAQGRPDEAARCALEAVAAQEEAGARGEVARSRILAGRALAAMDQRDQAIRELERAYAELDQCGSDRSRDEAARELRRLGRRVRGGKTSDRQAVQVSSTAGLSRREQEVAALVAEGRTNRQLAEELFLSEKTIETHLRNIFRKLGVSSRAAVAAATLRGGDQAS